MDEAEDEENETSQRDATEDGGNTSIRSSKDVSMASVDNNSDVSMRSTGDISLNRNLLNASSTAIKTKAGIIRRCKLEIGMFHFNGWVQELTC